MPRKSRRISLLQRFFVILVAHATNHTQTVSHNMIKEFTPGTIKSLKDLWKTDFASAGIAAMKLIDSYVDHLESHNSIRINDLVIKDLIAFLTWKYDQLILQDISVFNSLCQLDRCEKIIELLKKIDLEYVEFENFPNNGLAFIGS